MNELKPCPFCGGEAELYGVPHIPKGWDFIPRCKTTSCCGRQAKKYSNRETAIAAWNHRVDTMQVVRGEWEPANPICPVCGEDKFKGLDADIWSDWTPAYCPNCGAKMEDKS